MKKKNKLKVKHFIKRNIWLTGMDVDWGNGYVCIPKGHKAYGLEYEQLSEKFGIDIHGGLTFSSSSEELQKDMW